MPRSRRPRLGAVPDARRLEHGTANPRGAGAQPTGAVEAWTVFTGSACWTAAGGADEEVRSNRWTPCTPEEVRGVEVFGPAS
jgi:hypothetical protein